MQLASLVYRAESGWTPAPPAISPNKQALILVFGASSYHDHQEPLRQLEAACPGAVLAGCSTSGEILDDTVQDESLTATLIRFRATELRQATAPVKAANRSFHAGLSLAQQLEAPDLRGVLVFSDGLCVNGSELVRGLNAGLPDEVVVTGGLAGDGDRFERTWVLSDQGLRSGQITAVGLYGDAVRIGHGSKGGWDIFGIQRRVTRSEANVLFELDGKPALDVYKDYLGEKAADLPASALLFPLSLQLEDGSEEESVVRTVLSVDEEARSMTFAGDLPEGSIVQLMRANFDRLIEGASEAALMTGGAGTEQEVLSIAISCVGRRLILGERIEEELEAALETLPAGTRQVGFYSYGEISPYASGRCSLHNQTMTLTTICED